MLFRQDRRDFVPTPLWLRIFPVLILVFGLLLAGVVDDPTLTDNYKSNCESSQCWGDYINGESN